MSHNTFGHLFRVTTFGESHGPALGCVVDGCPPGSRSRPPRSRPSSTGAGRASRASPPSARSRTGEDPLRRLQDERTGGQVTTGTPIALLIENVDQRSKDYSEIKDKLPPGPRGLRLRREIRHPRLSRRRALLGARDGGAGGRRRHRPQGPPGVTIRGALVQMGPARDRPGNWDWDEVPQQPVLLPGREGGRLLRGLSRRLRKAGSSIGAVIEVVAEGVPPGLGAPSTASSTRTSPPR
jgi:chorismate synthase